MARSIPLTRVSAVWLFLAAIAVSGCREAAITPAASLPSASPDPKAYSDEDFRRIEQGLNELNVGRILIQQTHPTGTYRSSTPPALVLSADRRTTHGRLTITWTGSGLGNEYQTDFSFDLTKDRVRLQVDRDLAIFKIDPHHHRLAEEHLEELVRSLQ